MNLPDRVNLDLRQREQDNDDAEEYFSMNRDSMIEEEVYRLEKEFGTPELSSALLHCPPVLEVALWQALKSRDALEVLCVIEDIRDAWIKRKAEEIVENA